MLSKLFVAAAAVQVVSAQFIFRRQTNCADLQLVIARGTDEPNGANGGKYGAIVGDPLFKATQRLIPGITGFAVPYPASSAADSQSIGIQDTVDHLKAATASCPNQKYALIGYSQGADVIHYAAQQLPSSIYSAIVAVVQFGDPTNRSPNASPLPSDLANKVRENCAYNEPVCTNNGTDFYQHLSYNNAGTNFINGSATYIQNQFQSGGTCGPDNSDSQPPGPVTAGNAAALASLGALLKDVTAATMSSQAGYSPATSAALNPPVGMITSLPMPMPNRNTTSSNSTSSPMPNIGSSGNSTTSPISSNGNSTSGYSPSSSNSTSSTGSSNSTGRSGSSGSGSGSSSSKTTTVSSSSTSTASTGPATYTGIASLSSPASGGFVSLLALFIGMFVYA